MYDHTQVNLIDTLLRSCRRTPGKDAIIFNDRSWTYAQLVGAVETLAQDFSARGLSHGDRVVVRGANSDLFLIAMFACFRIGAVHIPMNVGFTSHEAVDIIRRTAPALILTDDPDFLSDMEAARQAPDADLRDDTEFMALGQRLTYRDRDLETVYDLIQRAATGEALPAVRVERDDIAQIIFTSGTTSKPKGAMMSHGALSFHCASATIALHHHADDSVLSALPLYHAGQMHSFTVPALMVGATVVIAEKPKPEVVFSLIEQHSINNFFAPPTVWIALLNHDRLQEFDLSSMRKVQYGASIMPAPILTRLRVTFEGVQFYNAFGQTEVGPTTTVLGPEGHDVSPTSAGRAVTFVDVRIVDEDFHDVEVGDVGEIVYRSPQLFSGYLDDPVATAEAFIGEWFRSGDLGRQDEHHYIHVVDRLKDVINTGGVLVSSREVEEHVYDLPGVAEVAAVAVSDPKWVEAVAVVIVRQPGADVTTDDVIDHCKRGLAHFKAPKYVRFIEELPKSGAGKILKRSLRDSIRT